MQFILCVSLFLWLVVSAPSQTPAPPAEPAAVKAAQQERSFTRHNSYVPSVAFSPDGKRLASAGRDRVKVTDLESGKELLKLKNSRHMEFRSVAFSPDGRWLAGGQSYFKGRKSRWEGDRYVTTYFHYGEVLIWDAQTGTVKATINIHEYPAWQIAFSPDNRWLALATGPIPNEVGKDCEKELCDGAGEIFLVETNSWKLVRRLRGKTLPIQTMTFSPDGRWLVGSSRMVDGVRAELPEEGFEIFVWDVASGTLKHTLPGHARPVTAMAFSPDGHLLASAGRDLSLKLWDMRTFQFLRLASEYMISSEELTTITDQAGKKKAKDALPRMSWLTGLTFTKDGDSIIGSGGDGILRVYETASGKIRHIVKPRDWPIMSWDQSWDMSGMQFAFMYRRPIFYGLLNSLTLSPDGRRLATGGADGKIRVMELAGNFD